MTDFFDFINNNTGMTLLLSSLGFGINEGIKYRNSKKVRNDQFKNDNVEITTRQKEKELYELLSKFCLSPSQDEEFCIGSYNEIRKHVIENDLFLREPLTRLGYSFAEYIIEKVQKEGKDLGFQQRLLKQFKKEFRS